MPGTYLKFGGSRNTSSSSARVYTSRSRISWSVALFCGSASVPVCQAAEATHRGVVCFGARQRRSDHLVPETARPVEQQPIRPFRQPQTPAAVSQRPLDPTWPGTRSRIERVRHSQRGDPPSQLGHIGRRPEQAPLAVSYVQVPREAVQPARHRQPACQLCRVRQLVKQPALRLPHTPSHSRNGPREHLMPLQEPPAPVQALRNHLHRLNDVQQVLLAGDALVDLAHRDLEQRCRQPAHSRDLGQGRRRGVLFLSRVSYEQVSTARSVNLPPDIARNLPSRKTGRARPAPARRTALAARNTGPSPPSPPRTSGPCCSWPPR